MKKKKFILYGLLIGIINALFGSGGGLIAVSAIKSMGFSQKKAQACALAIMLFLSCISAAAYIYKGYFNFSDAVKYIPFGFAGALLGTKLLKKIPDNMLKKIFALFILWAGIRILFR